MVQRKRDAKPYPWRAFPFAGTVLKNLFSKPVTTGYPFEPAQYPQRMRGHVEIKIEDCISCGLCARNCPPGALKVDRAAGTWTINRFDCVQCGNCTNVCPKSVCPLCPATPPLPPRSPVRPSPGPKRRMPPRRARPAANRKMTLPSAFTVPCARKSVPRAPLRWTGQPKAGSWTRTSVSDAASVPLPARKSA